MDLLLAFAAAMSITMALIPLLHRFAGRLHVLDEPQPRKVHTAPMPRVGGMAMAVGALVPLLVWLHGQPTLSAYLSGALLLLVVGVWDDRSELSYQPKLLAQVTAALIMVLWGGAQIHSLTAVERIELPQAVSIPLSVLFIVGVTNAINLSDGLDGLAGGTTLLCCFAIALLAHTSQLTFVATVAVVSAGSILGFLRYNTHPARVFMGDGGSQFLGFTVATLAVLLTQDAGVTISAALPLLLLGLPILDTLMVMALRLREGRSPFSADKNHIHHRLLALGFDHHEAVIVIYGVQALLFLLAWYLRYESDGVIVAVYGAFALAALGAMLAADRSGWRWRQSPLNTTEPVSAVARRISWLRERDRLPLWSMLLAALGAAIYSGLIVGFAGDVPDDVGNLAAALLLALLLARVPRITSRAGSWIEQCVLYVAVVIVVYLGLRHPVPWQTPAHLEAVAFGLLALCVLVAFRSNPQRRFRLTPLDLIVIFMALALPNLSGSLAAQRSMGLSALILLVLFYTIEMLFNHSVRTRLGLVSVGALALLTMVLRAWF